MTKTIALFLAHALAVIAVLTTFGVLGLQREDQEAQERFTGVLEENVTLQILDNDTAKETGYLDELLSAFNEEYAQYGIKAVDANMGAYTDLEKLGPAGYGPDVVYQANDALMRYALNKHIQPLPVEEMEAYSQIPKEAWDAYRMQMGEAEYTFAVPVNVQEPLLYYRKDLLPENWQEEWDDDKNGVPDMVENWADLYAFSAEIKASSNGTKFGYMKSLNDQYFAAGYFLSYGGYIFGKDETGAFDTEDIGLSAGESYKGARIIRQLAAIMDNNCADDTITTSAYELLGNGTYFATMTTPDVTENFITEMTAQYETEGLSYAEADAKARENLVIAGLPKLPASGDLSEENPELVDMQAMGGINGYAISAYTKVPNAALEFVKFATSYEMVKLREEMLGVAPCREDVVAESDSTISENIFSRLESGLITLMPSISEVAQIWTPGESFNKDLATDPTRAPADQKYKTQEDYQKGLDDMCDQILEAITTLA